jgi:hypothetical protein
MECWIKYSSSTHSWQFGSSLIKRTSGCLSRKRTSRYRIMGSAIGSLECQGSHKMISLLFINQIKLQFNNHTSILVSPGR